MNKLSSLIRIFFSKKLNANQITISYVGFCITYIVVLYIFSLYITDDIQKQYSLLKGSWILFICITAYLLYNLICTIKERFLWTVSSRTIIGFYVSLSLLYIFLIDLFFSSYINETETMFYIVFCSVLLFLIITTCLLYMMLVILDDAQTLIQKSKKQIKRNHISRFILGVLIFCLVIGTVRFGILELYAPQLENKIQRHMESELNRKSELISNWLKSHRQTSETLLNNPHFISLVENHLENPGEASLNNIKKYLKNFQDGKEYNSVLLLNNNGNILLRLGKKIKPDNAFLAHIKEKTAYLKKNKNETLCEFHGASNFNIFIPIVLFDKNNMPIATILLYWDTSYYFDKNIRNDPTLSLGREMLITRHDGDKLAIFSSEHGMEELPNIKGYRKEKPDTLFALAEKTHSGTTTAKDHHGDSVLAVWTTIPETNWLLLLKYKEKYAFEAIRRLAFWVSTLISFVVVMCGIIFFIIRQLQKRTQALAIKYREEQIFNHFYTLPFIGMVVLSLNKNREAKFNDKLIEMLGYTRDELETKNWRKLIASPASNIKISGIKSLLRGEIDEYNEEEALFHKNGQVIFTQFRIRCMRKEDGSPSYLLFVIRDTTEEKAAEVRVLRLHQLNIALNQCNQAILHCSNQTELLKTICATIVQNYSVNVAWIGLVDHNTKHLTPVAAYSDILDINENNLSLSKRNSGMLIPVKDLVKQTCIRKCIQDNQAIWLQNAQSNSLCAFAHVILVDLNIHSVAIIPLRKKETVSGILLLCAPEKDFFDPESQYLLTEMANDIDFALLNYEQEIARLKAEVELRDLYSLSKINEVKIHRLNQFYAALASCNQAMVRCKTPDELFSKVCTIVTQYTNALGAWVGLINANTKEIVPVAAAGTILNALKDIIVSSDPRGPNARAVNENIPVWTQDLLNDSNLEDWHYLSEKYNVHAIATLPIHRNGVVTGTFNLFSDETHIFDQSAQSLLIEMTNNIDFALAHFEHEAQLQLSAQVFAQSNEGIVFLNENNNIVMVNKAFTMITGYLPEDVYGRNPRLLASGRHDSAFYSLMWKAINNKGNWQGELWNKRKDGTIYPQWTSIRTMHDNAGNLTNYISIFSDLTERKETEKKVHWLAHFDGLTGLPNRTLLQDRCNLAISIARRRNESLVLMFMDLDNFKNVNDSLGHNIGDVLLKQFAERLRAVVREQDTISRLGGDEFVVVLPNTDIDGAAYLAERLLHVAAQPYLIETHEISLTASIGIAVYPTDGGDFSTLSRSADAAMYRAKQNGRNDYCFFTREMQENSVRLLQLDNALRRALERKQLAVHYQPKLSLADNSIVGFEALLRFTHPDLGSISPAEFIPVAESNGQIIPIGEWVLQTAMDQLKLWLDKGYPSMVVSVNLSSVQFRHPRLPEVITHILERANMSPHYLVLELTEGVTMENPLAAISVMDNLHQQGIRISIDDFGTGYSSLAYLKRFSVSKLKIDRSFVQDIVDDPEDRAIVDAIISLARSLDMKTIAEGVETAEQLAVLEGQGCDEVQGYYIARPLPAHEAEQFLENHYKKYPPK